MQIAVKKCAYVCVRNKHVKAFCDIFLVHNQQMPKKSENANNMHKLPQRERVLAGQQLRPSPCPSALQSKMC